MTYKKVAEIQYDAKEKESDNQGNVETYPKTSAKPIGACVTTSNELIHVSMNSKKLFLGSDISL